MLRFYFLLECEFAITSAISGDVVIFSAFAAIFRGFHLEGIKIRTRTDGMVNGDRGLVTSDSFCILLSCGLKLTENSAIKYLSSPR